MSYKRDKAHGTEVDISNGALFLRIVELERTVKWLDKRLAQVDMRDAPIGGSDNTSLPPHETKETT